MSWIPLALSSLGPATFPHLSAIRFAFADSPSISRSVETLIKDAGSDLQRIADEVARIEREFRGAVNLTLFLDSAFEVVLDTLNVSFHPLGWRRPRGHVYSRLLIPSRYFGTSVTQRLPPSYQVPIHETGLESDVLDVF